jgi:hypothetical protein
MKKNKSFTIFVVTLLFFSAYIAFGAGWIEPTDPFPSGNTLAPIDVGNLGIQNRSGLINFDLHDASSGPRLTFGIHDLLGSSVDNSFVSFLGGSPIFSSLKPLYMRAPAVVLPKIVGNVSAPMGALAFDLNANTLKLNLDGSEAGWSNIGEQKDVWIKIDTNKITYSNGNVTVGTFEKPNNLVVVGGSVGGKKTLIAKEFVYFPVYDSTLTSIPISLFVPTSTDANNLRKFNFSFETVGQNYNYDADKEKGRLPCDNSPLVLDCLDDIEETKDINTLEDRYDVAFVSPEESQKNNFFTTGYVKMKYKKWAYTHDYEFSVPAMSVRKVKDMSSYPRYYCDVSNKSFDCKASTTGTTGGTMKAPPPDSGWPNTVYDYKTTAYSDPETPETTHELFYFGTLTRKEVGNLESQYSGGGIKFSPRTVLSNNQVYSNFSSTPKTIDLGKHSFCALGKNYVSSGEDNLASYCRIFYYQSSDTWKMTIGSSKDREVSCSANCF